jgi:diguanylate cyclase
VKIKIPALSGEARRTVLLGATGITLLSVAGSLFATFIISAIFGLGAGPAAYAVSAVVPILLAGPGSYFQLKRLEQVKAAYRELERVASTDWLTGCLNRRAFTERTALATSTGRPGALLVVDADGFKSINDRFGHDRGDDALRAIVDVIRDNVRDGDIVGRIGGEEFGIYLPDASDRHATAMAEAIREGVEDISFSSHDAPEGLSVSVGIATTTAAIAFDELFRCADQQLYAAKASGRNRVAITAVEAVDGDRVAA